METDCTYLSYQQTHAFSALVNDYLEQKPGFAKFQQYTPDIDGLKLAIEERKKYPVDRQVLVQVLRKQYAALPENERVNNNIEALLNTETFTICTAHQPNLLTGYLYFFYKILHAIKMAESLKEKFPQQNFVPVYYMGSEDNDLDELGQFRYDDKKYTWDADGQKGAVGRMKTKSLKPLLNELFRRLGPPGVHFDDLQNLLTESYLNHATVAEATQYLVHQLFGRYGLVIINPDEAQLKAMFESVIADDLLNHTALPIVTAQSSELERQYKSQAFPRPVNLFYLKDDIRERIEEENGTWKVLNTEIQFSEAELLTELKEHPERFSPNVILRGLFQETILPNVCFIGGGSELAYWLQLKPLFEYYKVFYPVIVLRQSVQIINERAEELMSKLGLEIEDVFVPEDQLVKRLIEEKYGKSWSLTQETEQLESILNSLEQKARSIDATLELSAKAALVRIKQQALVLEQKMYRAEKRKEQVMIERLKHMRKELFPGNGLQERVENFMTYYLYNGFDIFDTIKNNIKAFDATFMVLHPPLKKK